MRPSQLDDFKTNLAGVERIRRKLQNRLVGNARAGGGGSLCHFTMAVLVDRV